MPQSKLRSVFRKYKIENFPFPLFYCLPYALRFEIGGEVEGAAALQRAEEIFAASFDKKEEMLVVFECPVGDKVEKAMKDFECDVVPTEKYDSETGELSVYDRRIYACPCYKVPHTVLLSAILNTSEQYGSSIYFVSVESGKMMMLYDGRGCDVAAPNSLLLAPIYRDKKHLLSVIDLPQMKLNYE